MTEDEMLTKTITTIDHDRDCLKTFMQFLFSSDPYEFKLSMHHIDELKLVLDEMHNCLYYIIRSKNDCYADFIIESIHLMDIDEYIEKISAFIDLFTYLINQYQKRLTFNM